MAGVSWSANPEQAYYACIEGRDILTLELWVGEQNIARSRGVEDQPIIYGTNGPVQVLSYFNNAGVPKTLAFFLLPSGETHMFRVNEEQRIVKASRRWQCERKEWRAP